MSELGFIGLGQMGSALAQRLIASKYRLMLYDINAERLNPFLLQDVSIANSPLELANSVEVVFACLPSVEASLSVASQVAEGQKAKIYIEMSTIGSVAIRNVLQCFAGTKISLIDAPVSGGPVGARANKLSAIVAGEPIAVAKLEPILSTIAANIFKVGPTPGLAQICKLVNNAISLSTLMISCEAIVTGVKAGVNAKILVDVINASTGRSSATTEKFPKAILPRTFDFGAPMEGAAKDLSLYLELAQSCNVPAKSIAGIEQLWLEGVCRFGGSEDYTNVVRLFEEQAGIELAKEK